jgi:hypothetical protein
MSEIQKPKDYGSFEVETFEAYRARLPANFNDVPDSVIETWIYRHWSDFQAWLPLCPLEWKYSLVSMSSTEVMRISHVDDWPDTLRYWGDDLLDGRFRKNTWLGKYMLEYGTTPVPMIVATNAAKYRHPKEDNFAMKEPYQIIEGHMRLAYLQALIRRAHPTVLNSHDVFLAELPLNSAFERYEPKSARPSI